MGITPVRMHGFGPGKQSGQGAKVSVSSSARRRKLRRIGGICSGLRLAPQTLDGIEAPRRRFSDFAAACSCIALPRREPKSWLANRIDKLATAKAIDGGGSSIHAQAGGAPASIGGIADPVLSWSGLQAAPGVVVVSDGEEAASKAPARVPQFTGAAVMAADNAFADAVSANAMRGYDAAQNEGLAPGAQFDPITVMNKTWAPERPQAGGGNTGHEP